MTSSLLANAARSGRPSESLSELAVRHGSDKGMAPPDGHGYTRVYEVLLREARQRPFRILEIGLLRPTLQRDLGVAAAYDRCPSLDMWADYLPSARIFGWDLLDFTGYVRGNVSVLRADQGDRESLTTAAIECGGDFDLVIDDGSHAAVHQQTTLGVLFPFVRPGGHYIVEDLHDHAASAGFSPVTPTRTLLQGLAATGRFPSGSTAFTADERARVEAEALEIALFDSLLQRPNVDAFQLRDALAVLRRRPDATPTRWEADCARVRKLRDLWDRLACGNGCNWISARPVWIWGAGSGGRRMLAVWQAAGGSAAAFVDSDPAKRGSRVDGVTVLSPDALVPDLGPRPYVVVASLYAAEIEERLQPAGWKRGTDYLVVDIATLTRAEREILADPQPERTLKQ